jgi:ubiquinone/menaquinone biosynthesis C-methylase UbiE
MLDTSCGDWFWMKLIQNDLCNYTGIDVVKDIIDNNNKIFKNNKTKFIHNDFLTFIKSQPDKSIDLIFCRHTLEHLPTDYNIEFLEECKRVCKYLFVTGYNNYSKINTDLNGTTYRPINLNYEPYYNLLNNFYLSNFYDGPNSYFCEEMVMNVYDFN